MSKNTINSKKILKFIIPTAIMSAVSFAIYRILLNRYFFQGVLTAYMAITTALILGYLIYNRGFSRRGITEDMLPLDWSEEKKKKFVESHTKRFKNSLWLLMIICALVMTFIVDSIDLIILPIIKEAFGG